MQRLTDSEKIQIFRFTKSQIFTEFTYSDSHRVKYSQNTNFKIHRFTNSNCETTVQTIISLPSWIVQMPDNLTPFILFYNNLKDNGFLYTKPFSLIYRYNFHICNIQG